MPEFTTFGYIQIGFALCVIAFCAAQYISIERAEKAKKADSKES